MATIILVLDLFVTLAMIGVVLIQRSEGGGLGIGTTQGMGSFMSGRGTANLLTRTTAILAALFFGFALLLARIDRPAASILSVAPPAATAPAKPATPTVPTN